MGYFSDQSIDTNSDSRSYLIGTGSLGGKAQGLAFIQEHLEKHYKSTDFPQIEFEIPTLVTICTDVFDTFMEQNDLYEIAYSDESDDRIAHAFQQAELPFEVLGYLRSLVSWHNTPLAVRSSSLLEDQLYLPFAGVYATKMTPNNQFSIDERFNKLVEAIKFVYASTFFKSAKDYIRATKHNLQDEKMAVTIQEVIGKQFGKRFYPELSGVARSYNFYPMGRAKPQDGIVSLALGMGKTVVDGGITWTYSPAYPKVDPPYRTVSEMLKNSQTEFWAVNMGDPPDYDPINETEYMLLENLTAAEADQSLRYVASTYNPYSDRLVLGTSSAGARVITFAPLLVLKELPLNKLLVNMLEICEEALDGPVEIEFAMTFDPHRFGFLQVRPMAVFSDEVEIHEEELHGEGVLAASNVVLGNGVLNDIQDIVYVKRENFTFKNSRDIALELAKINRMLVSEGCPYLLVVYGRLGTTDPWLGIPVNWGQVSGARVIVEATPENVSVELSQGSHFFHNINSLGIRYFSIPPKGAFSIDWEWLDKQEIISETQFLRHARLPAPLLIRVDGRHSRGVIYKI
jgi:hypothetical protein